MKYLYSLVLVLFSIFSQAQNFFISNPTLPLENKSDEQISKQSYFNLNLNELKSFISEIDNTQNEDDKILTIPSPEGKLRSYKIYKSPVLEPSFQENFPDINAYTGRGITNPNEILKFTITSLGFQAIILNTSDGTQYITPVEDRDNLYSIYYTKDVELHNHSFECQTLETASFVNENFQNSTFNANDGILRNYRLAISATGEFSTFYNSDLDDVISAMVIAVSNANAVLERDLSVTMTMVDNTSLIFFDPENDPFTNFDNTILIGENQILIDNTIGDANYDLGHVFNTAGGGIAGVGVSCFSGFKAFGVTGDFNPESIFFDFVFLHELGHQFGSPHTFNGSAGSCGPNISTITAVEPGSGSTIMAYPGLCAPQNVQSLGDFYYHQISLFNIWSHISTFSSCPTDQILTGNSAPTADAGPDYIIPKGTPYKLVGNSSDPDGVSSHTFTWEQYDFGPQGAPDENLTSGPLVRSREGTSNPTRFIPRLEDLITIPGSQEWEVLSNVDRDLNFRLTVRDNGVVGGQTAADAMVATVNENAGPFVVTSQFQENQIVWNPGTTETITWDVAGTDANGIDESSVNILLSTDGGLTFDTVLATNTPNDGTEDIIVPNLDSPECRIMIEASNGIFFNINEAYFAIGNYIYGEECTDYVIDFNTTIPENAASYVPFSFQINESVEIEDLDFSVNITGNEDNGSITFGYTPPVGGFYELGVYPCAGTTGLNLTFDDEGNAIDCTNITSGDNVLPQEPLTVVDGQNAQGNWTFWITDVNENLITSDINSVTLSICKTGAIPNLSIEENNFEEFAIYPNPASNSFNLRLSSKFTKDISVEIFDINGRKLFNKSYSGKSIFEENIDVSTLPQGLYIVKVEQANILTSEKLIVK